MYNFRQAAGKNVFAEQALSLLAWLLPFSPIPHAHKDFLGKQVLKHNYLISESNAKASFFRRARLKALCALVAQALGQCCLLKVSLVLPKLVFQATCFVSCFQLKFNLY